MRIKERKPWARQLICGSFIPKQPTPDDGKDWKPWKPTGEPLVRISHPPNGRIIRTDAVITFQPPVPTIIRGPVRTVRFPSIVNI